MYDGVCVEAKSNYLDLSLKVTGAMEISPTTIYPS